MHTALWRHAYCIPDPADTSSYRAIAGSSLILKRFENVILLIWGHLLKSETVQFGFKQKTSTTQCTWLFTVTEVVQHFLRQGSHSIVSLLDCKAAFAICKFNVLFEKLLETGLPAIVVRVLIFSCRHQHDWVRMSSGSSVSILRSLASFEAPRLRGHALFLTVVISVLHTRNAVCMSQESCIQIYKSLAAYLVVSLMVNTHKILILLLRNMHL